MDTYTKETKIWLEDRFKECDESGIYLAHEPIYGYRKGHHDLDPAFAYACTYQIMRALSRLNFDSLLDVGGAEGYKASIAKQLFGIKVVNSDLSEEACKRAEEIYEIKSLPANIQDLPFKDNEYDVVLCSETLEHVADLQKAIDELMRVAKKALVITVPNEGQEVIDKNIANEIPHGHIHGFNLDSFNYLKACGYEVTSKKIGSSLLGDLFIKERKYHEGSNYPKLVIDIYNNCVPVMQKIFGKHAESFLIRLDDKLCKISSHGAILYIIQKNNIAGKSRREKVSVSQIMNFEVPFHYLQK